MNIIDLPNRNKKQCFYKHRNTLVFFGILIIAAWLKTFDFLYIKIFIGMLLGIIVIGIIACRRQDIRKVYFKDDVFFVKYRDKVINVPIQDIKSISSGIGQVPYIKDNMLIQVTILLKHRYFFGKKLYFSYNYMQDYLINPDCFPEDIYEIKKRLKKMSAT